MTSLYCQRPKRIECKNEQRKHNQIRNAVSTNHEAGLIFLMSHNLEHQNYFAAWHSVRSNGYTDNHEFQLAMQQYCVRSWPLIRLSTIANFHAVLRVSSWTNTTSSFLIDCLLDPVFLWNSRRDVRYSCFHRYQNRCRISACLLALCFRSKSSPKVGSVTSSSISGYASGVILRPYRCEGVNGSSSTTSPDT